MYGSDTRVDRMANNMYNNTISVALNSNFKTIHLSPIYYLRVE